MTTWKRDDRGSLKFLLGKVAVAKVVYDSFSSREDPYKYKAELLLPGFTSASSLYDEEDKAKAAVQKSVDNWLKAAGVQPVN